MILYGTKRGRALKMYGTIGEGYETMRGGGMRMYGIIGEP